MYKIAKSPPDAIQQKLRDHKKVFNKSTSTFINNLINFKKLMNGAPNIFHKEKGNIKDPIPADPVTIIGVLAHDFNEIAQEANSIIAEQIEYSKNRRKKQSPNMTQTNLPFNTASFENRYDFISEGSNKFTRFLTRLLTPTIGWSEAARIRKYRMVLLDACVDTSKKLSKFQVEIVKSSKDSISESKKILDTVSTDWMIVYRDYKLYKNNMPKEVEDAGGKIQNPLETDKPEQGKPEQGKPEQGISNKDKSDTVPDKTDHEQSSFDDIAIANAIIIDYIKAIAKNNFPNDPIFKDLANAYTKFKASPDKKLEAAKNIIKIYNNILSELNMKYGTSGNTLKDIAKAIKVKNASLEVLSQDSIRKWIGKARHNISSNQISIIRLDIYKMADVIRDTLNKIMDSLENGMSVNELDPLINDVNKDLIQLRGTVSALNNQFPSAKSNKSDSSDMSILDRMNIFRSLQ